MADSVYWIWLQLLFGIGTRRAELVMNYFESPKDIYDGVCNGKKAFGMLTSQELDAWETAFQKAEEIQRRTLKKGCEIITPDHESYPARLREIYSKPAVLYVKGELECLKDSLSIAMVGTRKHSDYGRNAARKIAGELAEQGVVVVSGFADGLDTECHQAALEAGGKTVGVLGCGIDVDYPRQRGPLKHRASENGAVVTEFPLGTEPYPGNFPIRNRVISGMCQGTVVVEADAKSGSLITANFALEQGRDVFAVPGSIFSDREQGTHQLIRDGAAKLVESGKDILEEYIAYSGEKTKEEPQPPLAQTALPVAEIPEPKASRKRQLPEGASQEAHKLYNLFDDRNWTCEELSVQADLDIPQTQVALLELELFGLIQGFPGRQFGLKHA